MLQRRGICPFEVGQDMEFEGSDRAAAAASAASAAAASAAVAAAAAAAAAQPAVATAAAPASSRFFRGGGGGGGTGGGGASAGSSCSSRAAAELRRRASSPLPQLPAAPPKLKRHASEPVPASAPSSLANEAHRAAVRHPSLAPALTEFCNTAQEARGGYAQRAAVAERLLEAVLAEGEIGGCEATSRAALGVLHVEVQRTLRGLMSRVTEKADADERLDVCKRLIGVRDRAAERARVVHGMVLGRGRRGCRTLEVSESAAESEPCPSSSSTAPAASDVVAADAADTLPKTSVAAPNASTVVDPRVATARRPLSRNSSLNSSSPPKQRQTKRRTAPSEAATDASVIFAAAHQADSPNTAEDVAHAFVPMFPSPSPASASVPDATAEGVAVALASEAAEAIRRAPSIESGTSASSPSSGGGGRGSGRARWSLPRQGSSHVLDLEEEDEAMAEAARLWDGSGTLDLDEVVQDCLRQVVAEVGSAAIGSLRSRSRSRELAARRSEVVSRAGGQARIAAAGSGPGPQAGKAVPDSRQGQKRQPAQRPRNRRASNIAALGSALATEPAIDAEAAGADATLGRSSGNIKWEQIGTEVARGLCLQPGVHRPMDGCPWCEKRKIGRQKASHSTESTFHEGAADSSHASLDRAAAACEETSAPSHTPAKRGGRPEGGNKRSKKATGSSDVVAVEQSPPVIERRADALAGEGEEPPALQDGSSLDERLLAAPAVVHSNSSLDHARSTFRAAAAEKARYAARVTAGEALLNVCMELPSPSDEGEAALKELWVELRRTQCNMQCRLHYRRNASEKLEVRKRIAGLRRRLRAHARAAYDLDLEAATTTRRPAPAEDALIGFRKPVSLEDLRARCELCSSTGSSRHLCELMCYFREYEPARQLQTLRKRAAVHPLRPCIAGWTARLAFSPRSPYWCVVVHDAAGGVRGGPREAWASLVSDALAAPLPSQTAGPSAGGAADAEAQQAEAVSGEGAVPAGRASAEAGLAPGFTSPFGLIEELLARDPWQLMVTCFLLNKTGRECVDRLLATFFRRWPTPEALMAEDPESTEIGDMLGPLGLQRRRSHMLVRFSREYSEAVRDLGSPLPAQRLKRLHGVGRYALDAYRIFVRGEVSTVKPTDIYLGWFVEYQAWRAASSAAASSPAAHSVAGDRGEFEVGSGHCLG